MNYVRFLEDGNYEEILELVILMLLLSLSWYYMELYKYGDYYLGKCLEILQFSPFSDLSAIVQKLQDYLQHPSPDIELFLITLQSHLSATVSLQRWIGSLFIQLLAGIHHLASPLVFTVKHPAKICEDYILRIHSSDQMDNCAWFMNAILAQGYCQETRRHHLLSLEEQVVREKDEVERAEIGEDRLIGKDEQAAREEVPGRWEIESLPKEWILLELVFDANCDFFAIARWAATDPNPLYLETSQPIVKMIKHLVTEFETIMDANNASFSCNEASKSDPEYVKQWWKRREEIDMDLRKWQLQLESQFLRPFSFVFHPWYSNEAFDSVVEEIVSLFVSRNWTNKQDLLQWYLHCNTTLISWHEFAQILDILGIASISASSAMDLAPLLQKYHSHLSQSSSHVVLMLSPSLQNLPLESPFFHSNHISVSRHICLESVLSNLSERSVDLTSGSYIVNISLFEIRSNSLTVPRW